MIFDDIFFPDNKKKEKKIKNLEKQLENLFENYHKAWNNFCIKIDPRGVVPRLRKSVKESTIEECIEEIDTATRQLDRRVKNVQEKLEMQKLIGRIDYKVGAVESKELQNALKYSPILSGALAGSALAILVCKQMIKYAGDAVTEKVSLESGINAINTHFDNIVKDTSNIIREFMKNKNYNMRSIYIYPKLVMEHSYDEFKNNIECIKKGIYRNKLMDTLNNKTVESINRIVDINTKVIEIIEKNIDIKDDVEVYMFERMKANFNLYVVQYQGVTKENIQNIIEDNIEYVTYQLNMDMSYINKLDACEITKTKFFTTKVVGVVIVVMTVIIIDAITSFINGTIINKQLNRKVEQMDNIVRELTKVLTRETYNLIELTQSMREGIIRLDKNRMILIDKTTDKINLIELKNI
ncbi:MAG: hypothetical protein ACRCSG_06840 [Cellulosilyticaceae bacterium]